MKLTSIVAIYFLFWVMSAFFVLPFGLRTPDEDDAELIPGQATSAPVNFQPKRIAIRATLLSLALFAVFYVNYVNGWVTSADLDITRYIG
ncbi:MAG: DUF1467 family protein [Novosphingobium sp.]